MPDELRRRAALVRLIADGLVVERAGTARTSRPFQGAMARAAFTLYQRGEPWRDLRLPIALALSERYGHMSNDELAELVEAMLPIEAAALAGTEVVQSPEGAPGSPGGG
jgi:hypothetical protein